jgi:DNA-binding response OmpR family regulator
MRLLIVEDDPEIADLLARTLRRVGWASDRAQTVRGALEAIAITEYDLVILDLGLPDGDGLEVCRRARAAGRRVPVLMLTARGSLPDRVEGLDAGADDYLTKPFAVDELMARLRALARRPQSVLAPVLAVDDLELDSAARRARRGSRELRLTGREFALLEYLMRETGRVLSRGRILEHVWDDNFDPVGNAVDVLVGRVRRKVDGAGARPLIHTVRGVGYVLTADPPPHAG